MITPRSGGTIAITRYTSAVRYTITLSIVLFLSVTEYVRTGGHLKYRRTDVGS